MMSPKLPGCQSATQDRGSPIAGDQTLCRPGAHPAAAGAPAARLIGAPAVRLQRLFRRLTGMLWPLLGRLL
jgi:hypothetical protein